MFSQAFVILFTGECLSQCMLGYTHPREQTPPAADTPWQQTPPRAGIPQSSHPPWSRHHPEQTPPRADTTPGSRHPQTRHPREQTPPKQTPPQSRHPPEADMPHPPPQSMLGDTVNARAVRILLECNLVLSLNLVKTFNENSFTDVLDHCSNVHVTHG